MTTAEIQSQISAAAIAQGVDPALALAVANQESGFNPSAVSSKGATGLFQLMPATAAGLGVSNPLDPTQNINGGVALLAQLDKQYNGDTSLVLAAYNAGPTAVNNYGGIPPFPETQNYVASILAALGLDSSGVDPGADSSGDGSAGSATVQAGSLSLGVGVMLAAVLAWALFRR